MEIRSSHRSRRRPEWSQLPLMIAVVTYLFHALAEGSTLSERRHLGGLRGEKSRGLNYKYLDKRAKIPDSRGSKLTQESYMVEAMSFGYLQVDGIGAEQFDYCYNALEGVAVDGKVCYPQYREFLYDISNGQVSEDKPPGVFVLIFYSAACSNGQDCAHSQAYISMEQQGVNLWILRLLCEEVLSNLETETTVSFEFSLRYDAVLLNATTLATCISNATENLLYEHFGCSSEKEDHLRRRAVQDLTNALEGSEKATHANEGGSATRVEIPEAAPATEEERQLVLIQDVFSSNSGHWDRDSCPYSVMTEVVILDIACIPTLEPTNNSTRCGLVQSSVTVQVPQLYQPFEDALYRDVASTLRNSINTGTFEQYFPPDCLL